VSDELESRLAALEDPARLAQPLRPSDFWLMAAVAFIIPLALLLIAWGW